MGASGGGEEPHVSDVHPRRRPALLPLPGSAWFAEPEGVWSVSPSSLFFLDEAGTVTWLILPIGYQQQSGPLLKNPHTGEMVLVAREADGRLRHQLLDGAGYASGSIQSDRIYLTDRQNLTVLQR